MTRAFAGISMVVLFVFIHVGQAVAGVCVEPPAGLVGWWPADGNAVDIAGNSDGALMGGATFVAGEVGQAFLMDGIDAFVNAGNAPSLHVSQGDFTVEAWVSFNALSHPPGANRDDAPPGDVSIVDKMSTRGVNADGWRLLKQADDRFWFCLGGGIGNLCMHPAFTLFSTTAATTGVWYHLAAVKSATGFSLYVDGQLEDSRSPLPDFMDLHVGDLRFGANALQGTHLNGLIDEVALYGRALSATEIQAIYLAGSRGKCKAATVLIDIKPGSFPNNINPKSRGVVPVAIRTTDTFHAFTINPFTVRFGRTGTEAAAKHVTFEDIGRDGKFDMILHFETEDTGITCGGTSASLTGHTWGGKAIHGSDSIQTVGCR
ncbi:MAG TPA: LamG domain-containing protein [Candidatus Acidoferrum sp.]|nr:LamG domain-containing protein [Candidatus Acidoferrum sp.]